MSEEIKNEVVETPVEETEKVIPEPVDATDAMLQYTAGDRTLEETNEYLKKFDAGYHLDPMKNVLTGQDILATTLGTCNAEINGWGFLDTGTGSLDKVQVINGHTKYQINTMINGKPNMIAYVLIGGKMFAVHGDELVDYVPKK